MTDRERSVYPVHGLNDSETVEWNDLAGISIMLLMRNGCCQMLLLIVVTGVLGILTEGLNSTIVVIIGIYNIVAVVVLLLLFLYVLYLVVQVKRTTYYITSQRLLEVRGKSIRKEIPRVNLHGLAPDQYLKSVWAQKHGTKETYNIYVTDPVSGVVVRMTSIDNEVVYIIERWAKKPKR